jgi:HAD superfamily hydrolase (TIGR01490 family)
MKKIALYDVDYTVISVNSMFSFFIYSIIKKPFIILYLPLIIVLFFLWGIKLLPVNILKSFWLMHLKGMDKKEIEAFSKNFVNKCLIPKIKKYVIENIDDYRKKGYLIIFATASYEFYIKYLAEYFKADYFFGTKILFIDNRFYPKVIGRNCRGKEKIRRILEVLPANKIDKRSSVGFSDSTSDLPYLELVDDFKIVSTKKWKIVKEYKN